MKKIATLILAAIVSLTMFASCQIDAMVSDVPEVEYRTVYVQRNYTPYYVNGVLQYYIGLNGWYYYPSYRNGVLHHYSVRRPPHRYQPHPMPHGVYRPHGYGRPTPHNHVGNGRPSRPSFGGRGGNIGHGRHGRGR